MNRVVLCGRLAGRPKLSYTPCGISVAEFRLLVPRERPPASDEEPAEWFDCVAFREPARELASWGERNYRVNLEGRLRREAYRTGEGRYVDGIRIHADRAYFVDPPAEGLGTDPGSLPNVPLPVAILFRRS